MSKRDSAIPAALVAALWTLFLPAATLAQTQVTGFGSNPGNLQMFRYVPAGLPANAPVVVALHGCAQSASNYDAETGWVLLADRWKFTLVLPQQQTGNNSSRCFNWFEAGDISRGQGEALSIKQMVDRTLSDQAADPARVYVTGLSAGGAMTSVMLATYPDVFAGGAVIAGIPYNCGTGTSAAFSCMNPGSDLSPASWGNKVRAASSHGGPWPIVSIWHGDADTTVRPVNATESMEQWTHVHGSDQTPDVQDTLAGYPHKVWKNASGKAVVETVLITGMGHGTPVDPGAGATQCGTAGAYILDVNVCSSYYIGKFFGLDNTDQVAPTANISAPLNGETLSGAVTIAVSASDNLGVARVEFLIDGLLAGSDTASPYTFSWNSAAVANGQHTLQARAVDAAGNVGTSSAIVVTVAGGVEDTTAPTVNLVFPGDGATIGGTVTLAADANDDYGVARVEFLAGGVSIGTGNPSAQAGPWTLSWNTTAWPNGSIALAVRAWDAKGNTALDNDTTVTISQNIPALDESFSARDGGDYFDNVGWSGDFVADTANATVGGVGSQSSYGYASSGISCASGQKLRFLSRSLSLGSAPRLAYSRKLDLKANINTSTTAHFKMLVNGNTIDSKLVSNSTYVDSVFQRFENIDLGAYANQTVTLRFEAGANSNVCLEAWAKVWIDDIRIANAEQSADTTPPTVNLTAPVSGATLSGSVDLVASAADASGVAKVEFHANGALLSTDTAAPFVYTWNSASVANGSYALMTKAYDPAGNVGTDADTTVTVSNGGSGGTLSASFANEDAQDGYVKANADGSSAAVGTLESSMGLALGRGTDAKFNRALLSFDTASLPDNAVITGANLTVGYRSASGDPWNNPAGNSLVIDARSGCFGACSVETGDWSAAATATAVAGIVRFTAGTQNSAGFSAAGLAAINKTGRTQLKLRFSANQTATHYLWIANGGSAQLRVEYVLP